jgi:hypothetical protein
MNAYLARTKDKALVDIYLLKSLQVQCLDV